MGPTTITTALIRNPQNSIGNYLGPCSICFAQSAQRTLNYGFNVCTDKNKTHHPPKPSTTATGPTKPIQLHQELGISAILRKSLQCPRRAYWGGHGLLEGCTEVAEELRDHSLCEGSQGPGFLVSSFGTKTCRLVLGTSVPAGSKMSS